MPTEPPPPIASVRAWSYTRPTRVGAVISVAATILMLGVLAGFVMRQPVPGDAASFHERVSEMVDALPASIGAWTSIELQPPQAANQLLKPNALWARKFTDRTGRSVTVIFVQCKEPRDMAGHYPPRCYPGQGWRSLDDGVEESVPLELSADSRGLASGLTARRYDFSRPGDGAEVTIFGFFVLPGVGVVTDMDLVYERAADYPLRPFGAAQIQALFTGPWDERERVRATEELLSPMAALIELMSRDTSDLAALGVEEDDAS